MPLQSGQVLSQRYRIVRLLGQGGFGAVYRAWDINLTRPCALKENLDTSLGSQRQFEREAIMLAGLSHPNLPRVTDHFFLPGQGQYLVMDFIEGDDSEQIRQRTAGPLPPDQVLDWILQVCDALIYLHSLHPPVIHRDIKPANLKITPEGKAMLVDFGIAKQYNPDAVTTVGARAITSGYSPPEQYGRGITDAQSDVYALGATLYTLLTGLRPPDSIDRMANSVPPLRPVRQVNPAIPAVVEAAIQQALQLDKSRRPASVAEFKAAICGQAPASANLLQVMTPTQVGGAFEHPPAPAYTPQAPAQAGVHRLPVPPAPSKMGVWPGVLAGGVVIAGLVGIAILAWFLFAPVKPPLAGLEATQTAQALAALAGRLPTPTPPETVPPAAPIQPTPLPLLPAADTALPPMHTPTSPPAPSFTPLSSFTPPPSLTSTPSLPPVVIEPYCTMFDQSPQYAKIGQPVILWWRWDAKTRPLVEAHIAAATYEIYLDGVAVQADRVSEIEYLQDKQFFRVSWYASVGVLSPGTHHTERYLTWSQMITDGWETFGPGGKIENEHHDCEIIVR